ncbi:MAG: P44/Msp2 family outer membrane protein [Pseudomonadota bacterium]
MVNELAAIVSGLVMAQSAAAAFEESYSIPNALGLQPTAMATLSLPSARAYADEAIPDILAFQNDAALASFDAGSNFGRLSRLATGFSLPGPFRVEAEVSYLQHNVDMSRAFTLNSQDPDENDEALLFDRTSTIGTDFDAIVTDGLGKVETKATFANGFMDLPWQQGAFSPYLGAGVGVAEVDVDYRPNGVEVLNQSSTVFAYQFMVGADYSVGERFDWTMTARYRGMSNHDVRSDILPSAFRMEGDGLITEFGLRYGF